jgi:hypothetical protein
MTPDMGSATRQSGCKRAALALVVMVAPSPGFFFYAPGCYIHNPSRACRHGDGRGSGHVFTGAADATLRKLILTPGKYLLAVRDDGLWRQNQERM